MSRSKSVRKGEVVDIRSRIKHENSNLGAGVEFQSSSYGGSIPPSSSYGPPPGGSVPSYGLPPPTGGYTLAAPPGVNGTRDPIHRTASPYSHKLSQSITSSNSSSHGQGSGSDGGYAQQQQQQAYDYQSGLNAGTPMRPARSVRRPHATPPPNDAFLAAGGSSNIASSSRQQISPSPLGSSYESPDKASAGRNLLGSSRAAAQSEPQSLEDGFGGFIQLPAASSSRLVHDMHQSAMHQGYHATGDTIEEEEDDVYGGLAAPGNGSAPNLRPAISGPYSPTSPQALGSLTQKKEPTALNTAISALSAAGRKHQANRIQRGAGMSTEDEKRRRRSELRIEEMRKVEKLPLERYAKREDPRAFREINAVLRKANAEWTLLTTDDFNAAALAISMMEQGSFGADWGEFERMNKMLERALQGTLDDHYEAFASAITLHNNVLSSLSTSQSNVSAARKRLRDSRDALGAKRSDLVQMWHKSQGIKESLKLLDTIDNLRGIPDHLEHLLSEKRFLQAVNLLTRGLKTIDKPEIVEVAGTSDLRSYLKQQEQSVLDILVEELHNHLYLKTPACNVRWQAYTPGQTTLPASSLDKQGEGEGEGELGAVYTGEENVQASISSLPNPSANARALERFLRSLSTRPSFDPKLAADVVETGIARSTSTSALTGEAIDDTSAKGVDSATNARLGSSDSNDDPEENSFFYIEMLLESVARLDKLGHVLDTIAQRLQVEIYQVVETTMEEVERRSEPSKRHSTAGRGASMLIDTSTSSRLLSFGAPTASWRASLPNSTDALSGSRHGLVRRTAAETFASAMDAETMRDLFWTLFSKFSAILQGHRAVYEVSSRISSRAGFSKPTLRATTLSSPVKVWRQMQAELRTMLHDHLVDETQPSTTVRRQAIVSINDIMRFGRVERDKSKRLYSLPLGQQPKIAKKDAALITKHEEELTAALRVHVPGLVSSDNAVAQAMYGTSTVDLGQTLALSGSAVTSLTGTGHRVLVKPDAFNLAKVFSITLKFIEQVHQVMPPDIEGSSDYDSFLEEFIRETFLPQLEERAQLLFTQATSALDAFQEDPSAKAPSGGKPVTRSVRNVVTLIDGIYSILAATPFHRVSISRLIVQLIVQYYQRCHDRYTSLVTLAAGDASSTSEGLHTCAAWAQRPEILLCLSEIAQASEESTRRQELLEEENAILSQVAKQGHGILFSDLTTSRKKLLALGTLKHSLTIFSGVFERLKATSTFPETQIAASLLATQQTSELALPLNDEMIVRFQGLPTTFQALSNLVLFTLREELRIRTAYYLNLAVTDGNYTLDEVTLEPDPHVVDLNAELVSCDDVFADTLSDADRRFLFLGLAGFMDLQLVTLVRKMRAINRHGVTKMVRNVLALQQNLKSIVDTPGEVNLERSRRFWDLLLQTPEQMLASLSKEVHRLGFEEYKSLLHLMLGLENARAANASALAGTLPATIPGAGTAEGKEVSRNQYNEYLIELHQVVGDA